MVCSNYWILDKIDKIIISLIFIVVTMFSIFNSFCFAYDTSVDMNYLFNCTFSGSSSVGNTVELVSGSTYRIFEIPVYYGYNYNIEVSQSSNFTGDIAVRLLSFDELPSIGSKAYINDVLYVSPGNTGNINYFVDDVKQEKIYLCLSFSGQGIGDEVLNVNITTDYVPNGFSDSINLLVENVSFSSLWSTFEKSLPYVLIVVVVAFGIYLIVRMIKGLSKGKGRL